MNSFTNFKYLTAILKLLVLGLISSTSIIYAQESISESLADAFKGDVEIVECAEGEAGEKCRADVKKAAEKEIEEAKKRAEEEVENTETRIEEVKEVEEVEEVEENLNIVKESKDENLSEKENTDIHETKINNEERGSNNKSNLDSNEPTKNNSNLKDKATVQKIKDKKTALNPMALEMGLEAGVEAGDGILGPVSIDWGIFNLAGSENLYRRSDFKDFGDLRHFVQVGANYSFKSKKEGLRLYYGFLSDPFIESNGSPTDFYGSSLGLTLNTTRLSFGENNKWFVSTFVDYAAPISRNARRASNHYGTTSLGGNIRRTLGKNWAFIGSASTTYTFFENTSYLPDTVDGIAAPGVGQMNSPLGINYRIGLTKRVGKPGKFGMTTFNTGYRIDHSLGYKNNDGNRAWDRERYFFTIGANTRINKHLNVGLALRDSTFLFANNEKINIPFIYGGDTSDFVKQNRTLGRNQIIGLDNRSSLMLTLTGFIN